MRRVAVAAAGILVVLGVLAPARADTPVAQPVAQPVATVPATGALFYPSLLGILPVLGGPHFCSASVLHSPGGNLVATAAHCVFGTGAGIEFAPLLHDDQLPAGVWQVQRIYVDPA